MTQKLDPKERRAQILAEALRQAARVGYQNIKRQDIATALGVSPALVSLHFSTMPQLKRDVMRAALATAIGKDGTREVPAALRVVGQGLAMQDKFACKAPEGVRQAAVAQLAAA